jgi:hypothetical protein
MARATDLTLPGTPDIRPVRMRHGSFFLERDFVPRIQGPSGHVLIQLSEPLNPVIEQDLKARGVELLEYIPENTWKALVPADALAAVWTLACVQAIGNIYPVDKFPVHVLERGPAPFSRHAGGSITMLVSFFRDVPFSRVKAILVDIDGITAQTDFISGRRVLLKIPEAKLAALAEYDEVSWIENRPLPKKSDNANAAALSNIDDLHTVPYSLDGQAVPIAMWDGGEVKADHPDLSGRVTVVDTGPVDWHATHVAGTMISAGTGNLGAKGMAPTAGVYSYDYYDDVPMEMHAAAGVYNALLANHSWGYITGWHYEYYADDYWVWFGDENFGAYTSTSRAWDQAIVDTGLIIVKSAGNDRNDVGDELRTGHYHYGDPETLYFDYHPSDGIYECIGQIGSSKNVITVGSVGDYGGMSHYSSYGPTDDGRIKPDLMANGEALTSTCTPDPYCIMSGTSQATPVVCGSIALIAQRYEQLTSMYPAPEVIKALLVGTAFELGEKGPDYGFGWGLVDAKSAVDLVEKGSPIIRTDSIENGEVLAYPLTITSRDKVVQVTLAWTDPAGSPAANEALVNDIDLELVDPQSAVHLPWVLDKFNPSQPAAKGVNTVDNTEQVQVNFPTPGTWTIRVKGASIQGSQSFALVTYLKDEFQVNDFDAWFEERPSAAGLTNGSFVVTWDSKDLQSTTVDTYGRVFDAQGDPVSDDFGLNQTTADTQIHSAVAALSTGGFVAVWDSDGQDGHSKGVYARVFDNNGNAFTSEFRVNVYTNYAQEYPAVAGLANGNFVVAWTSLVQDSSDRGVFARLFNKSGSPLTGDIQVNTTTFHEQSRPSVAALQSGDFVVAWRSFGQDGHFYGIFARRFNASGIPLSEEFQVNTHTTYSQYSCTSAGLTGGGFVIAWQSSGQDGDGSSIHAQVYNSSGNKIGGEFQVNTYTRNDQAQPTASPLPEGGFMILWQSDGQDGNHDGIFGRRFDSDGNPAGAEEQLNIYTVHNQAQPCSARLNSGDLAMAWESVLQGGSGYDIYARVLNTEEGCPADFDEDGDVDGSDAAICAESCDAASMKELAESLGDIDCQ